MTRKKTVQTKTHGGIVAALDVGTSKVCCLIARKRGEAGPEILGIGHHAADGLRNGAIVDMEAAEASIRHAVAAAEQMAGETIREVTVNLSAGAPKSQLIAYEVAIAGHEVTDADLRGLLDPAAYLRGAARENILLHAIPVGYTIDGNRGVRDPRGMFGDKLGVNLHLVSAAPGAMRNLQTCISRCQLEIAATVVSPYASALSCLVDDEKDLGVVLVDMGGGTTSIAVFFDGELVHTDVIPVGGVHVTNDIARGLSTPIHHAERMKTLYGNALPSPSDDREVIRVPLVGEEEDADSHQIPRSVLVGIIRPRLEEIFELVRARLEAVGYDNDAGRRVVLTGGASQLPGVRELAGSVLDKQVRLGRPKGLPGLAEAVSGPAFGTCVGLLDYAFENRTEPPFGAYRPSEQPAGRWGRIGQWLRDNFHNF